MSCSSSVLAQAMAHGPRWHLFLPSLAASQLVAAQQAEVTPDAGTGAVSQACMCSFEFPGVLPGQQDRYFKVI